MVTGSPSAADLPVSSLGIIRDHNVDHRTKRLHVVASLHGGGWLQEPAVDAQSDLLAPGIV